MAQERTVLYENNEIRYLLEQKPVKKPVIIEHIA